MTEPVAGQLLTPWRGTVLPEWTDYNGHLRDAYYLLVFSMATDAMMDMIGLDEAGRAATGHSMFTLESHINYLLEVKQGHGDRGAHPDPGRGHQAPACLSQPACCRHRHAAGGQRADAAQRGHVRPARCAVCA
jgi:hypothetical protein